MLVTNRNDGGNVHSGLDFDVLLVKQCHAGDTHCENAGGTCVDGYCFCGGDVPCSCRCDGEPPNTISTGVKIGVVVGTLIPIFLLLFIAFYCYRKKKIQKSREQKEVIKQKEEELKAFCDSVVGMRTAIKKYIPAVSKNIGQEHPLPVEKHIWCWKETEGYMDNHDQDNIFGDPADCWIKYNKDSQTKLEAAYSEQGGAGTCSSLPGYSVNFNNMKQTKLATGYERDVLRCVKRKGPPPKVDLTDAEIADELPDDLSDEPQMVLVEGDVIQISKQRPDGWAFGSKLQHADEALARQLVLVAVGAMIMLTIHPS